MEIYKIRFIRTLVVKLRCFILVSLLRKIKTITSDEVFEKTISHNLKGLYHCNDRIDILLKPLTAIEKIKSDSKVLIIGPRNEHDIYLLNSYGVKLENIVGLDLISYSSKIKIGDMHSMVFDDNSFDAVVCGWTLSYSSYPQKAIDEIVRVTKNRGIVAIGVEYSELKENESKQLLGYSIQEFNKLEQRINSTAQICDLFGKKLKHIYFNHDAPLKRSHTAEALVSNVSNVCIILEIEK